MAWLLRRGCASCREVRQGQVRKSQVWHGHQKENKMFQQITIVGNLGKDPEMRYTPTGTPVTNFNVATSRSWSDSDGSRKTKTVWFRVAAWNKLAEITNQYLTKGQKVLVVGEVEEPNVYTGNDGQARASLEVRARTVQFLNSKAEAEEISAGIAEGSSQQGQQTNTTQSASNTPSAKDFDDSNIPF